jgi:2-amino-4-hydroxy-6-hydroxymethyldihydropteridine diphosphokinase
MLMANSLCVASMSDPDFATTTTLVALGSNMTSRFGGPVTNIRCGLDCLKSRGLVPVAVSPIYRSTPLGTGRQQYYANAVAVVDSAMAIGEMMRVVKQIERQMGRRSGVRWGPRPLDIDILSHRGQMASGQALGWVGRIARPTVRKRGQAVLPHPEIHKRAFVLQPLCDVAPHWVHPVFNKSAKQLFRILQTNEIFKLQQIEDSDFMS